MTQFEWSLHRNTISRKQIQRQNIETDSYGNYIVLKNVRSARIVGTIRHLSTKIKSKEQANVILTNDDINIYQRNDQQHCLFDTILIIRLLYSVTAFYCKLRAT